MSFKVSPPLHLARTNQGTYVAQVHVEFSARGNRELVASIVAGVFASPNQGYPLLSRKPEISGAGVAYQCVSRKGSYFCEQSYIRNVFLCRTAARTSTSSVFWTGHSAASREHTLDARSG